MTHKPEDELRRLIADYFGGDLVGAAAAITRARGKRASVRTLQAWLAPDNHPSKRNCPADAISSLRRAIADPGFSSEPRHTLLNRASKSPARTDSTLASKESGQTIVKWSAVKLADLPEQLEEVQKLHRLEMEQAWDLLELLFAAIRTSRDYDELRATVAELRGQQADERWQREDKLRAPGEA